MTKLKFIILILLSVVFFCCNQGKRTELDTSTSGDVYIVADDAYKPIIDAEIEVFTALYHKARIRVKYEPEDSVFRDLLYSDTVRLAVTARKLTKAETDYFHSRQLHPEEVKIATDAMAFIVNNSNTDTLLTVDNVQAIFSGQDSTWQSIDKKAALGKITVVFDHENSSNSRYIRDSVIHGHKFPAYCFAVHSNEEVINYVSKNAGAIGVISTNWISDNYDSTVMNYLKQVKVVGVSTKESTDVSNYHLPYLSDGSYAFSRDVYVINREARTGLGSGFLSFIMEDKGQRVVFRSGLMPAFMPSHSIQY